MRRFILPIACAFPLVAPKAGGQIPVVKDARVISFEENKVPDNWKGAGLAINTAHYKDGKQSCNGLSNLEKQSRLRKT